MYKMLLIRPASISKINFYLKDFSFADLYFRLFLNDESKIIWLSLSLKKEGSELST